MVSFLSDKQQSRLCVRMLIVEQLGQHAAGLTRPELLAIGHVECDVPNAFWEFIDEITSLMCDGLVEQHLEPDYHIWNRWRLTVKGWLQWTSAKQEEQRIERQTAGV